MQNNKMKKLVIRVITGLLLLAMVLGMVPAVFAASTVSPLSGSITIEVYPYIGGKSESNKADNAMTQSFSSNIMLDKYTKAPIAEE